MLTKSELDEIEQTLIKTLVGEIKDIIDKTRKNMVIVEEKADGDSATIADMQIGEIFDNLLPQLLSNSIVIQEESFNEKVFENSKNSKHVWVVDPIDGTKAFRDPTNTEWCVGICLLENYHPILSLVYIPEKWFEEPMLLSAHEYRKEIRNFGHPFKSPNPSTKTKYVSHTHKDTQRNDIENAIADLFANNESIRAYAGHSTLVQFVDVAVNNNKVFSRRDANIWDIIQSAYLIKKSGCEVYYANGEDVFPINQEKLIFKDNHLIMPFTIASSKENKIKILNKIKEK